MSLVVTVAIVLSIVGAVVIGTAIKREGEWDKFKENNRKQPKDDELPKEQCSGLSLLTRYSIRKKLIL